MKLLTKLKLGLEGIIHEVSLDWRVVAVELNEDLARRAQTSLCFRARKLRFEATIGNLQRKRTDGRTICLKH